MTDPIVTTQTPNLYGPAQSFGLTNRYDYKGLDPELALAERAADQRQLIANAILNQSSVPRRGKMVGRLYQKAHWAEGLGQLGEAAAGAYLSDKIQADRAKAEEKSQKGQAAELAAYRQAIDPRAATDAEMVPNIRGENAGKIAEAMLAQSGVAPLKGQYAPQAPGAYQVAQFDQPRAEVDPAVQAQAAAQADEQAAAQAAYAVNPNAGGYNMNNAPEAVLNPAPAPAAMTRPEVPSVDLAQQAGMLERPAQAAFTPTPQQERAAIAALRTSQYSRNRELGKEEFERVNQESLQRRHDAERAQDQALHLTERGQDQALHLTERGQDQGWKQKDLDRQYAEITQRKDHDKAQIDLALQQGKISERNHQEMMARLNRDYDLRVREYTERRQDSREKITNVQNVAGSYGSRMEDAFDILMDTSGKSSAAAIATKNTLGKIPLVGDLASTGVNLLNSRDTQRADQAQRNFINAVLRRESGAVISSSEFDNARLQYFEQVGDLPELKRQKRLNMQEAIRGVAQTAGPAWAKRWDTKTRPTVHLGSVRMGDSGYIYRFKGGDEYNKDNWQKIDD